MKLLDTQKFSTVGHRCLFSIHDRPEERINLSHCHGDCLEGEGIYMPEGGVAVYDRGVYPKVGDIVICNHFLDSFTSYMKKVRSIQNNSLIVETNYIDSSKNFYFFAEEFIGVVLFVTDKKGNVIWKSKRKTIPLSRCPHCGDFYAKGASHRCSWLPAYRSSFSNNPAVGL